MLHNIDILNHSLPSPVEKLDLSPWTGVRREVFIKRDDLIHPQISGNKWRKLKYNLSALPIKNTPKVVSFGGAFSNHVHALAAACHLLKIQCVTFIRGELDIYNPTLSFCHSHGMELIPVSRSDYKLKENSSIVQEYLKSLSNYIIVPEGGTNLNALKGVREIIDELKDSEIEVDTIVLPVGTGGTTAGLLSHPKLNSDILAFSALKSNHLYDDILHLVDHHNKGRLTVDTQFHRGGYAKYDDVLLKFISDFELQTGIPLDHVYNGKAMLGLIDLIKTNFFPKNKKILYLHTGGIQGKAGIVYKNTKNQ